MYGYGEARTKDGRLVLIGKRQRARVRMGRGYYNIVTVIWLDEERRQIGSESIPLGRFNKEYRPVATGHRRVFDAGSQTFV